MSIRKYKIRGPGWTQIPDAVVSVTNTSANGKKVAIALDQNNQRALPPNGCQQFPAPVAGLYALSEVGNGELTAQLPD